MCKRNAGVVGGVREGGEWDLKERERASHVTRRESLVVRCKQQRQARSVVVRVADVGCAHAAHTLHPGGPLVVSQAASTGRRR